MSNAISVIPLGYDVEWVGKQLGLDFSGWVARPDGVHVVYPNELFEKMTEILNNYQVAYLAKAVPMKLDLITAERDKRIESFMFDGMQIVLDDRTKTNISGSVLGLDRNPSIKYINWSFGAGQFIQLPRAAVYAIADAAFLHIQTCFNNHKALVDKAFAAKTVKELNAIDISKGWPA